MRIIAGTHKGRAIVSPKGQDITRPALAKVREAIFSSIGSVENFNVIDVFAGTGSLGFEALSRGASKAYFIENHPTIIRCIISSIENLQFGERARVIKRRLPEGLKTLKFSETFDLVFCDPPYDKNLVNVTLNALIDQGVITADTLTIVEHSPREAVTVERLSLTKQRQYGQTFISYLSLQGQT